MFQHFLLSAVCHILNKKEGSRKDNGLMFYISGLPLQILNCSLLCMIYNILFTPWIISSLLSSSWFCAFWLLSLLSLLLNRPSKLSQTYHLHMNTIYRALIVSHAETASTLAAKVTAVNTIKKEQKPFLFVFNSILFKPTKTKVT